jgi:hypothetical protein
VKLTAFLGVTPCSLVSVCRRFELWWCLRNCTEHWPDHTAVRSAITQCLVCYCECGSIVHCVIAQCLVCYCECGSPSAPVTAVSRMLSVSAQALHAALYRFIYSLLTLSSLGTLQGILVCYCECGSPSAPVTAVSWMLSVSAQAIHAALYRSIYSLLTCSFLGTLQVFLGTFAKFRIANFSSVMFDCPFFRPYGTTRLSSRPVSMKFYIWIYFEHILRTFKFSLKFDQNNVRILYIKTLVHLYLAQLFLELERFQTKLCINSK